uniref:CSON000268 protein n=1 Tax=Culicoides sonorensis TaxID=179676 RepID=A0A336MIC8_CULSO
MKLRLVFVLVLVGLIQRYVKAVDLPNHYYSRVVKNARDPLLSNRCLDRHTKIMYRDGFTSMNEDGKCEMIYCDLERYKLSVKGCNRVSLNYDMHQYCFIIKGEYNQPYPYCCDQVIHKGR